MRSLIGEKSRGYFNSRPHEEVDEDGNEKVPEYVNFNSRPHEEVDRFLRFEFFDEIYFNSRPHEEVDICCAGNNSIVKAFQLTTSRRGRRLNGRMRIML